MTRATHKRALVFALLVFTALRILTILVVVVAGALVPPNPAPAHHLPEVESDLQARGPLSQALLAPWYRWDTTHYLQIADQGYAANLENTVWPPLYPALIRILGLIFQPSLLAALVVSSLATILAFYLLYWLVTETWDETRARSVCVWTAIFPTGFYLLAGYTEALFLALTLGALLAARHQEWLIAGLLGAMAAMTRIPGVLLIVPILWEAWLSVRGKKGRPRWVETLGALSLTAIIPASLAAFSLWVRLGVGADWPWSGLAAGWHLRWEWPWVGFVTNLGAVFSHPINFDTASQGFDLLLGLWGAAMLVIGTRMVPRSFWLYGLLIYLSAVTKILDNNMLMSVSRYMLPIFPLFMIHDRVLHGRAARIAVGLFWLAGQVLLLYMFYRWIWVA